MSSFYIVEGTNEHGDEVSEHFEDLGEAMREFFMILPWSEAAALRWSS